MVTINDESKFENIILNIENEAKKIREIFEKSNNNIEKINGTEVWSGIVQEEFVNKYKELSNNYANVNESLNTYIKFMRNIVNNYKNLDRKLTNEVDNNVI